MNLLAILLPPIFHLTKIYKIYTDQLKNKENHL